MDKLVSNSVLLTTCSLAESTAVPRKERRKVFVMLVGLVSALIAAFPSKVKGAIFFRFFRKRDEIGDDFEPCFAEFFFQRGVRSVHHQSQKAAVFESFVKNGKEVARGE